MSGFSDIHVVLCREKRVKKRWINSVGNLAGYFGPAEIGRIRDATHSMTLAYVMLALSLLIAGLSLIYITKAGRLRIGNVAPARS